MDIYTNLVPKFYPVAILLILGLLFPTINKAGAQSIAVCNGLNGSNLPSAQETVDLYKSKGIGRMRIYYPDQATLQALKGSNIELILGVPNSDLQPLASNASAATQWVQKNVTAYSPDVKLRYIYVGNKVEPNDATSPFVQFVIPAMRNIHNAIVAAGLQDQIKISTSTHLPILGSWYRPSEGVFRGSARSFMVPIIDFLINNSAPLLTSIYPYYKYTSDTQNFHLPYALFTESGVIVRDGSLDYTNLFDLLLDALYSAVEEAGGQSLEIVVSETGWPSTGGTAATVENANTYYKNLINHVKGGTPKRPGKAIDTYLFAMFDENQSEGAEIERHYGLFSPNRQPKYEISSKLVSFYFYCPVR